jgi:hypothetical protein
MDFTRPFFELYGCGDLFDPRLMPYLKITGRLDKVTVIDAGNLAQEQKALAAECYHLIAMILIRAAENYLAKHSREQYFGHRHRSAAADLYYRAALAMRQSWNAHLFFITNNG